MKNFLLASLACLALLVSQNDLNAQITWSPSVNLIAGGDNTDFISQNGSFVLGINPGGATTTVGTAVFTNLGGLENMELIRMNSGPLTSTQNGVTFSGDFDNLQAEINADGSPAFTFARGEFTDATPGINALIATACWNHNFSVDVDTVTLTGLTPGDTYELQILVNDARGGGGGGVRDERWFVAFTNGDDNLVGGTARISNRPFNDGGSPGMAGDFIIGTFVAADNGTQTFRMSATRGNSFGDDPETTPIEVIERDQFIIGETIDIASNDPAGATAGGQTQINALQLRNISDVDPGVLLGDANCDKTVDFLDIAPFIAILTSGDFKAEADIDGSLAVDFLDIAPFIAILTAN